MLFAPSQSILCCLSVIWHQQQLHVSEHEYAHASERTGNDRVVHNGTSALSDAFPCLTSSVG